MLDFDLYAIYTDKNECSGSIDELFVSFEEAMNNRMKYANWFCEKGDIWIKKISREKFSAVEEWHINDDGTIGTHYVLGRKG